MNNISPFEIAKIIDAIKSASGYALFEVRGGGATRCVYDEADTEALSMEVFRILSEGAE